MNKLVNFNQLSNFPIYFPVYMKEFSSLVVRSFNDFFSLSSSVPLPLNSLFMFQVSRISWLLIRSFNVFPVIRRRAFISEVRINLFVFVVSALFRALIDGLIKLILIMMKYFLFYYQILCFLKFTL